MIRNRILIKSAAVFFLLEILASVFSPAVSWALTSGPTAPEATSFEPVDTTDMVSLISGDLAYNLPLLEVPGPNGGYPLSLSYHAGIQPNEEASWVGLGWTLNPGAITRDVNGYADDHLEQPNFSRFYWRGGSTESVTVGVTVGLSALASVSAGLTVSHDTYMGTGVGGSLGVGFGLTEKGLGGNASIGIRPHGGAYASAGLSMGVPLGDAAKKAGSLSFGIGISTNFESISAYESAGLSVGYKHGDKNHSASLLGASISSRPGGSAGLSVAGVSKSSNITSKRVTTRTSGWNGSIPTPVPGLWVHLGYNYRRYWIDELDKFKVNGTLYFPENTEELSSSYFDKNAYDTYSLLDPDLDGGIVDHPDPDRVLGGSFPGYDNYMVHAQGIAGAMRPYHFQRHIYKRNNYSIDSDGDKVYKTKQFDMSKGLSEVNLKRAEFRFVNDFSNRFQYTEGEIDHEVLVLENPDQHPLIYSFDGSPAPKIGEGGNEIYSTNNIQGSRNIQWLTNSDIVNKTANVTASGLMETVSTGFVRNTPDDVNDDHNIGAFVITNESGVKYHFALPAYAYAEYSYSGNVSGTTTFNDFHRPSKYAYTWYLTALTGPDYVDRGPEGPADGKFNEYDWGYWVELEYGKWTDQYAWRNPGEGMTKDVDEKFQNFSEGKKELYYLDAIRTKSHTALFFKDVRFDAKSAVYFPHNITETYDLDGLKKRRESIIEASKSGGYIPKEGQCKCEKQTEVPVVDDPEDRGYLDYTGVPTSSLKLSSVVLMTNEKLKTTSINKAAGATSQYDQTYTFDDWDIIHNSNPSQFGQCEWDAVTVHYHFPKNVYDVYDLQVATATTGTFQDHILRRIDFDTDYSLSPETSNSFDLYRQIQRNTRYRES
jgi:hypothetical protein